MIKYTTPTLKCTIPDIDFDDILLTLSQGNTILEKIIEKESVVDNQFDVYLTQEETGMFRVNQDIEAQLNIFKDEDRLATNIVKIKITKNLHDEVILNVNE